MKLWAAWLERRTVGELSRALEESRERGLVLEDAAGALIACVKALMLDLDDIGAAKLKAELDETLGRVRAAPPAELAEAIGRRRRDALVFAQEERRYLEPEAQDPPAAGPRTCRRPPRTPPRRQSRSAAAPATTFRSART